MTSASSERAANPPNREPHRDRHTEGCHSTECPCFLEGESWGNERAARYRQALVALHRYDDSLRASNWPGLANIVKEALDGD